jgi:aminoglycoside 3-N-acetyltransferase
MEKINLFLDNDKQWVTNIDLLNKLKAINADESDILFIHSSLSFGAPNMELKKKELLQVLFDVILEVKVKTICMPTFTFSFCNGNDYNPETSNSKMGVLNEFFRKQEGVIRSIDPLMSVALLGESKDIVTNIGHSSCGANCTFDKLRHTKEKVNFLFLGPKIGDCLTYMHYLEWLYSVDYRYERVFKGNVTCGQKTKEEEYNLFVRYKGVAPNTASYDYEQMMYDNNTASIIKCGNSSISIVSEENAANEYKKCLEKDKYFFVNLENNKLFQDKTFILEKEMVAM